MSLHPTDILQSRADLLYDARRVDAATPAGWLEALYDLCEARHLSGRCHIAVASDVFREVAHAPPVESAGSEAA